MKVLIVEDFDDTRELLRMMLRIRGCDSAEATNGQEAVELAASERPDLILMDLNLPVLDGWRATGQIKAFPGTKTIPIIALTAHAMSGDRQKALQAGCDDYDTKPVELDRLLEKIEALLGTSNGVRRP